MKEREELQKEKLEELERENYKAIKAELLKNGISKEISDIALSFLGGSSYENYLNQYESLRILLKDLRWYIGVRKRITEEEKLKIEEIFSKALSETRDSVKGEGKTERGLPSGYVKEKRCINRILNSVKLTKEDLSKEQLQDLLNEVVDFYSNGGEMDDSADTVTYILNLDDKNSWEAVRKVFYNIDKNSGLTSDDW
jgi:hypothetical protein